MQSKPVSKGKTVDLPAQVKYVSAGKVVVPAPVATKPVAKAVAPVAAKVAPAKTAKVVKGKIIGVYRITSVTSGFEYLGGSQDIDVVYKEYMVGADLDNSRSVGRIRDEFQAIQSNKKHAGKTANEVFTLEILETVDTIGELKDLKAKYGLKDGNANLVPIKKGEKLAKKTIAPAPAPVAKAVAPAKVKVAKVVEPEPVEDEEDEDEEEIPVEAPKTKAVKGAPQVDWVEMKERYLAGEKVSALCREIGNGTTTSIFYAEIRKLR